MSSDQRTRHSHRAKKFASLVRTVDNGQKQLRNQSRIDALESDFYESPNKLAEDELSDEYDISDEDDDDRRGRKRRCTNQFQLSEVPLTGKSKKAKKKKRINKKIKIQTQVRKNLNLKKMLKEENMNAEDQIFPNFLSIRTGSTNLPKRKFCSICLLLAKYTCPRCGEGYCSLNCHLSHKEIQCLRVDF